MMASMLQVGGPVVPASRRGLEIGPITAPVGLGRFLAEGQALLNVRAQAARRGRAGQGDQRRQQHRNGQVQRIMAILLDLATDRSSRSVLRTALNH